MNLISITEFIGRFHPVLVHLPIGILLIGLLLQLLSGNKKYNISEEVIKIVLLTGMFSALISCITGYMLSVNGEYDGNLVSMHMWMGFAVVVASMIMVVRTLTGKQDIYYRIASISLFILIIITGHLGGSITHGSDYLTAALRNDNINLQPQKIISNIQEAKVYSDVIQPIFQMKCYTCHSSQKKKGGLRLDDAQWILKGGKDGLVIKAGNANESELMKRMMLPKQEEHHMPPKEKSQLTDAQIAIINWWINEGADFSKKVKELPQPINIKTSLKSMEGNQIQNSGKAYIPSFNVETADARTIELLKEKGVIVLPVAQNCHFLMADFVNAYLFSDKDIRLLKNLKKQIIWLKMGNTKITDSSLYMLSEFKNLTLLDLNHTHISDSGIAYLSSLKELRYLNLVNTAVSEYGIEKLKGLNNLENLYLYKTNINLKAYNDIKKIFPKVNVDTGGYLVPLFDKDTMIVKPLKNDKK